ncbi:helix-turn-helix transcriptional regulator [Sporohalobacter salinus]|uniref:helix-turn-helix transcriptional regulator n=1 Tax=Sporohalobacter salinus TaxID=1494606 RepID=UPI00195FF6D0|nr:WYL domain-containing protein [Sporohalobacter salinus]MBM7623689.1 putative DNA-binding transcriptional regulator YafY [Sporohalobacter salinus]
MSVTGKVWRLIKLISLVEGKYPRYSRQEIMNIIGVEKTSFYRYIKELEKANIPIVRDERTNNYKLREDYYMKPPELTLSEALALIVGGNIILNNNELPYFKEINMAVVKLMAVLPDNTSDLLSTLGDRIHFTLDSLVDYSQYNEVFTGLNDAIQQEINVWIKYYTKSRDEITTREVSPYVLQFQDGYLYLIAYCHWRDTIKMFRVDRIQEFKETENKFKYPDDFSVDDYLGKAWGVERREEEIEVKIKFSEEKAGWIKENRYHPTQKLEELEDGSLLMTVETCSINEIKKWILGFGADAEVLKPGKLRKEVKGEVKKLQEVYGGGS